MSEVLKEAEELARTWAPLLGLGHYRIKIAETNNGNRGESQTDAAYPSVIISVSPGAAPLWADHDDLEELVLHELLHVVARDLRRLLWDVKRELPKATRRLVWKRFSEAEERLVETTARALVAAKRGGSEIGGFVHAVQLGGEAGDA
jgi:hypothetical protein